MKKKITLIVVAVLLIISLVVGLSYAFWRNTFVTTSINKINSSCFSMELTNEKNNIVLESTYPITDEKGKALTPYSFTITNTCDLFASYTINLEMLEGTTLNSKYIKTMINNEAITNLSTLETANTTVEGATESRVLFKGSLGAGDSTDYTFRLWMDYDTPNNEESMNKNFQSKITVTSEVSTYSPVENGFTNLAEALLVNEYQTTNVDVAKNKIASKQTVDFSKTAPIIDWKEVKTSSVTTNSIIKAAQSTIGTYGIVEKATKIVFGTSYTYNSSTGYYSLKNTAYYDPTTVDFSSNTYYYCGSSISLSTNDTVSYWDGLSCVNMKKAVGLQKVTDSQQTFKSGNKFDTKVYTIEIENFFSEEIESDKSDKGLYETIDDDGTAYYYRGNVTNNYVKFGGFYWRIMRINGDGSIRLIYNGQSPAITTENTTIGKSRFNNSSENPTYIGYMYSNILNTSYEDTIRNDKDSAIKITLDNWYKTNILDNGYSEYIADSGFCNNKVLSDPSKGGYMPNVSVHYTTNDRVYAKSPTLICENASNNLFTMAGNDKGNQKLTYPVGTVNVDELMMAGMVVGSINRLSYIQSAEAIWTLSPILYDSTSTIARMWIIGSYGNLDYATTWTYYHVRPVLNLKSTTEITGGIGTKNDPFIIK